MSCLSLQPSYIPAPSLLYPFPFLPDPNCWNLVVLLALRTRQPGLAFRYPRALEPKHLGSTGNQETTLGSTIIRGNFDLFFFFGLDGLEFMDKNPITHPSFTYPPSPPRPEHWQYPLHTNTRYSTRTNRTLVHSECSDAPHPPSLYKLPFPLLYLCDLSDTFWDLFFPVSCFSSLFKVTQLLYLGPDHLI